MKISKSKTKIISPKFFILSLSFLLSLSLVTSCEKGTEPEGLTPGRRDYTWTVDTLKTFNTHLEKMWGSSPTDIWAVGNGSSSEQTIWHYNGNNWTTDGISRGINPWCIYGFAQNDVWIGGADGKIWHYDGNRWSEKLSYKKELNYKYPIIIFYDIWGENPDDIYAVGLIYDYNSIYWGFMMHYNGAKWRRVDVELTDGALKKIRKENKASNNYYIWNKNQNTNPDSSKYFEFNSKELKEIYYDKDSPNDITVINYEVIFSFDKTIYSYSNSNFNPIIKNPFPNAWNAVYGKHRKDIIWMMSDGLTHYNGNDFIYILNFEGNEHLRDGFVFEKEIFFLANDFYNNDANNLIYHGVLK